MILNNKGNEIHVCFCIYYYINISIDTIYIFLFELVEEAFYCDVYFYFNCDIIFHYSIYLDVYINIHVIKK